jgi:PAS domain S-box-containing protein
MPDPLAPSVDLNATSNSLLATLTPGLLDLVGALAFVTETDGRLLTLGGPLARHPGEAPATLEALLSRLLLDTSSVQTLLALVADPSVTDGALTTRELPARTPDGEMRPLQWRLLRRVVDGRALCLGVASDPEGSWKLQPWVRLYSTLLAHVHEAVVGVDPSGAILHWGGRAEERLGESASTRLGRPFSSLFTAPSASALASGLVAEVLGGRPCDVVQELSARGGERLFRMRGFPLLDTRGIAVAALFLVDDPPAVSLPSPEPGELSSASLLAALGPSSLVAMLTVDADGIVRSWNRGAERLGGCGASRAIGKHVLDEVLVVEGLGWETLSSSLRGRGVYSTKAQVLRPNGTVALADLEAFPLPSAASTAGDSIPLGALLLLVDQTEASALGAELLFAKQAALTAVLAEGVVYRMEEIHTVLNPNRRDLLSNVNDLRRLARLVADGAPRKILDPFLQSLSLPRVERELDAILYEMGEGVHRLRRGVEDARRFLDADVEAPRAVRLGEVLNSAWSLVSHRFPGHVGIQARLDTLPEIRAVQGPLLRAFALLLLACLDSCTRRNSEQSVITFTSELRGGWLALDVVDDGEGFGVDVRSSLQDLSYLAMRPGIGPLMLGLCREEIRSAGGSLELGGAPGMGTVLRLSFPIATASAALLPGQVDGRPVGEPKGPVLVIEENDLVRRSMERYLSLRYQVMAHASANDVLKAVAEGRFAAAIIGFARPEGYGTAIVARLAEANPLLFRNTVILLPPGIRRATRDRLEACGAVLLPRSIDPSSLTTLLERLMSDLWSRPA